MNHGTIPWFSVTKKRYVQRLNFGGGSKSQFEPVLKNSNQRGFLQSAEPYGSKSQFENGRRAPKFEPFAKITNANTEKGEIETEIDETGTVNIRTITNEIENENKKINSNTVTTKTTNERLKPEGREEPNANIENKSKTKNEQIAKTKTKATQSTIQKFSNHIKFIDYIPTHELITYRHLFAYGFYIV